MQDLTLVSGVGTSTVTLEVLKENPFQDRADVQAGNIKVMVEGLRNRYRRLYPNKVKQEAMLAAALDQLFDIEEITWQERAKWSKGKGWLPLYRYTQIERNLTNILGNPERVAAFAIQAGYETQFGVEYSWRLTLLKWVMRCFASFLSPAVGFAEILPMMAAKLNRNKREQPLEVDVFSARMRTIPIRLNGQVLRQPDTDYSRLFWYPAFINSLTLFFMPEPGTFHTEVSDISLHEHFHMRRSWIHPRIDLQEEERGHLYLVDSAAKVTRTRVAKRIKLYREITAEEDTKFYTMTSASSASVDYQDSQWAWQVIQDIVVEAPDGHEWVLCRKGEIYCPNAGCGITRYDYKPKRIHRQLVFQAQWHLYQHAGLSVVLLLAATSGMATMMYWEWLTALQTVPMITTVVSLVASIFSVIALAMRYAAPLRARIVLEEQEESNRRWLRRQGRELEAENLARQAEIFPSQEIATMVETGDVSQVLYEKAVITSVDLRGFSKLGNSVKRTHGAQQGIQRLAELLRPWKQRHYDYDADDEMADRSFPMRLEPNRPISRHVNSGGDGYLAATFNHEDVGELVRPAIDYCFEMHDAAEEIDVPDQTVKGMRMVAAIVNSEGGLQMEWFGRTQPSGRQVKVRPEVHAFGINQVARLEKFAKDLANLCEEERGFQPDRFTVMPLELWNEMKPESVNGYSYEDLGWHHIRDVGTVHIIRVMDEHCTPVEWAEWEVTRAALANWPH